MAKKVYNVGKTRERNRVNIPQSKPVPGKKMIKNAAGGYVFDAGMFTQLERFLILGTEGPTYYASEKDRTFENYNNVLACLKADFKKTIDLVVNISEKGRAPSNDPALFVLALASTSENLECRHYALLHLSSVARIGTHLFTFVEYMFQRRGFGSAVRRSIRSWYLDRTPESLGVQLAKYQSRNGWSHRDVIRLAHVRTASCDPVVQTAIRWSLNKEVDFDLLPNAIQCVELMKRAENANDVIGLIKEYGAQREYIPTEYMKNPGVWQELLPNMGAEAMLRNLGNMASCGVFTGVKNVMFVLDRLNNSEWLHKNRLHPIKALLAMMQYKMGHGKLGSNHWDVDYKIVNALENAFYGAFSNVAPTEKRFCVALDVSGSMTIGSVAGIDGFTPNMGAAAMAMLIANTEKSCDFVGFSDRIVNLGITKGMNLTDAMRKAQRNYGATDASLAFRWASVMNKDFDVFVCITDNESWSGHIHPFVALNQYRKEVGHDVKLVTMAMTATRSTIGDTSDPNSLDVVGFDGAVPELISNFVK